MGPIKYYIKKKLLKTPALWHSTKYNLIELKTKQDKGRLLVLYNICDCSNRPDLGSTANLVKWANRYGDKRQLMQIEKSQIFRRCDGGDNNDVAFKLPEYMLKDIRLVSGFLGFIVNATKHSQLWQPNLSTFELWPW